MSTFKQAIENLLGWHKVGVYGRRFINNEVLFSSFGNDIHASDIVKTAIHRVADAVAKCGLKSVVEHKNPRTVEILDDDINAVLSSRVNPLCGLHDFLYKVAYLTVVNKNCFIWWSYDEVPIAGTPYVRRVTKGFYPIEHANVKLYYAGDEMRVELSDVGGNITLDCPYSDIIHVRLGYGANAYLGGDKSGRGGYKDLLGNLQTIHVIKEAVPKALQASLSLKGILSMRTVADADKQEIARDTFEDHLFDSKYGIVATDYDSEFTPINISATDIPSNILDFVRTDILAPFGVSLPIYIGKYTDNDYTAFYQTAVEGINVAIAEAMKITLFTPRQLAYGHSIKYYDKLVQSLSFERRQQIASETKEDALLTRDERRELLGYEPDGQPTRMSLNYIDVTIVNDYQLAAVKKAAETPTNAPTGGGTVSTDENPNGGDNAVATDDTGTKKGGKDNADS